MNKSSKCLLILVLFLTFLPSEVEAQESTRQVCGNAVVSKALPEIKVVVNKDFKYVGSFDFKIRDVAAGERFVFVDADGKKVIRMFLLQFEGFLPHIDDFYRYSFKNALEFGKHKFRQNNYAYSNSEARRQNPKGEGVLTEDFLKAKGYEVEDELMMSRFITVPPENKKHELILYYLENVSSSGSKLSEFYENDSATETWKEIGRALKERSFGAFSIGEASDRNKEK
ncbi:MAG: hypothetical protein HKN33_00850 [Pyrinomonadaceae bacterium]|nr:hypothetical protein [Pyrinomonadaceae bacterium]